MEKIVAKNTTRQVLKKIIFVCLQTIGTPNVWLGSYTKQGKGTITIGDKTFNDRQKKKDSKNKTTIYNNLNIPTSFRVLSNDNPEYMKKKVIWAYEHNLFEISR